VIQYLKICFLPFLLFGLFFVGCEKKSLNKMAKVHWDRDMCARCVMVISDRKNTTQVKNPATHKTYMFDDIGCVVLWFKENNITWQDKAIIWTTDITTGKWIDAKTAFWDTLNITPMGYGFSAHKTKDTIKQNQEIITFKEVTKRVLIIGK
jgi:hypothetical protein